MARKKVNLQWITNHSSRRMAFRKRCKSLMKKASQLTTLCGVKASVVAYGEGEAQPEVWPSVPEATDLFTRFKITPDVKPCKIIENQEEFLRKRVKKLKEQVSKTAHESREVNTTLLLHEASVGHRPGLVGVTNEELTSLSDMVDKKMRRVEKRLQERLVGGQEAVPETEQSLPQQLSPSLSSLQPIIPYATAEPLHQLVLGEGAFLQLGDPLPQQLPSGTSSLQPLVPYSSTVIHGHAPVEETLPQQYQQDWVMDMGNWDDIMQPFNLDGTGFQWPQDPSSAME
ncbi:hypothetical protein ACP70R_031465 [Stipagrostis hirtigluma subsp. patula]